MCNIQRPRSLRWCWTTAERHYDTWLRTPILERNHLKILDVLPRRWELVEDWFLPRVLATVPTKLKDSIMQEKTYGIDHRVVDVLFSLFKLMPRPVVIIAPLLPLLPLGTGCKP